MTTDLDRLHAVVEGKLTGPRVGHTFVACHEVAGIIGVNPMAIIFWFLPRMDWKDHILNMLNEILYEHGLSIFGREGETHFIRPDAQLKFRSITHYSKNTPLEYIVREETRGYNDYYIINASIYEFMGHV